MKNLTTNTPAVELTIDLGVIIQRICDFLVERIRKAIFSYLLKEDMILWDPVKNIIQILSLYQNHVIEFFEVVSYTFLSH